MNSEERKELSIQDAIVRKRKNLQVAYNLYKMGYAWNYKEKLIEAGFTKIEVDNACKDMYEIFENTLFALNMLVGNEIATAYGNAYGHVKGESVRRAREYSSMLSKLMLDNGTRLYSDMESIQEGFLAYVTRYTLYEFGCEYDEEFTLSQMEELTD